MYVLYHKEHSNFQASANLLKQRVIVNCCASKTKYYQHPPQVLCLKNKLNVNKQKHTKLEASQNPKPYISISLNVLLYSISLQTLEKPRSKYSPCT